MYYMYSLIKFNSVVNLFINNIKMIMMIMSIIILIIILGGN